MDVLVIAVVAVASAIVAISTLLVLGALLPRIPYVGVFGSFVWPTLIGPATLVVVFGTLLAASALVSSGGVVALIALVAAVLGALASAGSLVILGSQVVAARRAGAPISPRLFTAVGLGPKDPADDVVQYGTGPDDAPLWMHVYRPTGGDAHPVVVYVHGGGWYQGAPDENPAMLRWFADEGYLVVAPQYTLATDERPTWDVAMPQIGCALAWIAEHATEYGGDPRRLAAWGASAGANLVLAATYAAAAGRLSLPCPGEVPSVAAVAGEVPAVDPAWVARNTDRIWGPKTAEMVTRYIGGPVDEHPDRVVATRVATYLSPAAPPTLLTVSVGDHLVPVEGVRAFVEEATAAGVDVRTVERRWGDHVVAAVYDGLSCRSMLHEVSAHFRRHGV